MLTNNSFKYVDAISARSLARRVFSKYKCKIPVDIKTLVRGFNIDIEYANPPFKVSDIAAAFVPVKENYSRGLILVQPGLIHTRERFTLAHELYHALIDPDLCFFSLERQVLKAHEREADIFATELLMPRDKVIKIYKQKCKTVSDLARYFLVSKQAMQIRIKEVNLKLS